MKSKPNYKWIFGVAFMLGLLWNASVNAQLIQAMDTGRNSSNSDIPQLYRAQFLSLSDGNQIQFLRMANHRIIDLVNASYEDLFDPKPNTRYFTVPEFYGYNEHAQQTILLDPDHNKIYKLGH